jgi:hypothetical protein
MDTSWYLYCSRHVSISTKATTVTRDSARDYDKDRHCRECIQSQSTSVGTPIDKALDQLHKDDKTDASLFILTLSVASWCLDFLGA